MISRHWRSPAAKTHSALQSSPPKAAAAFFKAY
jgi:hypothetical protein